MKNPFVIVGSIFFVGILALVLFGGGEEEVSPVVSGNVLERPAAAEGQRMVNSESGFVSIPDVTEFAEQELENNVHVVFENQQYSILYYAHADLFLVSLLDTTDYVSAREAAEAALVQLVQLDEAAVCSLNVDVVIPPYVDFENAGSYGLSFCSNSVPFTSGVLVQ